MVKLILTDFDGTLFPKSGGELTPDFIQKIKKLTDCGCMFAVNSGRPYSVLKDMLRPILNRTIFVCNDGTEIMYKNCLLYKNTLTNLGVAAVCNVAIDSGLAPFAALRERTLPVSEDVLQSRGLFGEEIYKLVLVKNNASKEQIDSICRVAESHQMRVCFSDDLYLEFCHQSADKGVATEFLKHKFGITNGVVAFGDTVADFPMFKNADTVYLMQGVKNITYPNAKKIDNMQKFVVENF